MDYDVELWDEFLDYCEEHNLDSFITDYTEWLAMRSDGYYSNRYDRG